eukprot:CAMPEP_0119426984 /NCGR_PEP_ID=MMETSP1335-20130426/37369_1 /TAXON_ID=259385 /ORGANISM="Chrysoculter rhomboideus, Strain RCC1486" /LENGTH=73 /DNA_ID=CAMNT_0007452599 /DNA_START=57 /DNA_END=275 /DNA_ORIENTATION=-
MPTVVRCSLTWADGCHSKSQDTDTVGVELHHSTTVCNRAKLHTCCGTTERGRTADLCAPRMKAKAPKGRRTPQ